jgi:hypothetical protein
MSNQTSINYNPLFSEENLKRRIRNLSKAISEALGLEKLLQVPTKLSIVPISKVLTILIMHQRQKTSSSEISLMTKKSGETEKSIPRTRLLGFEN